MYSNTELLLEALLSIRETPVEDRSDDGICALVSAYVYKNYIKEHGEYSAYEASDVVDEVRYALYDLFEEWPEYSGSIAFPIASPDGTPVEIYFMLNKWSGSYGEARIRLLDWLIQRLQHE